MVSNIIKNVSIEGISAAVPKNIINNYELYNNIESHKILDAIGVKERRIVTKGQTTSDLCVHAANKLIKEKGIKKEQISILIFLTQTPDYFIPTTACILQKKLGLPETAAAFDINLGCSGYVYGLWIAYSLIKSCNNDEYALLLVGDTLSLTVNKNDPKTKFLFGDAGTATLLKRCEKNNNAIFHLGTEGRNYDKLIIPGLGFRSISSLETADYTNQQEIDSPFLYMDGTAVYLFTMRVVPTAVTNTLALAGLNKENIDFYIFHQANKMILDHFTRKIGLPLSKVPSTLEKYGNTTSASIPLTIVLNKSLRDEVQRHRNTLLLCGYGTGLSWGTCILTTDGLCIPNLIEV